MNNKIDISRRSFTIGAAFGVGAILTGFAGTSSILAELQQFDKEKNAFSVAPNIWLEIKKDNTIIITIPRSELGQGVRTSLSMITAEELDADWNKIMPINAVGDSKYGNQSTGGSTSIRVFWNTLRTAGAQVRLMMIAAAAQIWGIAEANCKTENSTVIEINGNRKLTYGELIDKVSTLPIPPAENIKLKEPSEFKIIGKTKWHIDNHDVVSGKAKFGSDFKFDGMKYAVVLRPEEVGGSLKSYDDSEAKKLNGFIRTYTISEGVAVVAESTYLAMKAADAVKVIWNSGPISNKDSKKISEELRAKIGKMPELPANTHRQIESVYEVPLLAHAPMEPVNSFANVKDGKCEIWTVTQNPQTAKTTVAKAIEMDEKDITVNVLLSGGGFGRGHRNDFVGIAAKISKLSGYPIKLKYTKSDDIKNDYYRPLSVHCVKAGIDNLGKINSWNHKVISQGTVKATNPKYDIPNMQNLDEALSFSIPTGSWRAVNNTQNVFVNECMIDELAVLANVDPLDYRIEMTTDKRMKEVLKLVAEKSNWKKPLPKNHGRGIATFNEYGGYAAHVVEVSVNKFGVLKVERIVAALDCGIAINPGNIEAQFMGTAIDALSTAIKSEITIKDGKVEQSGFHDFEWLTMKESPKIEVHIMPSAESPSGIGELGFPSVSPALCNAIYNATGVRVRKLPLKHTDLTSDVDKINNKKSEIIIIMPNQEKKNISVEFEIKEVSNDDLIIKIVDVLGNVLITEKFNKFDKSSFRNQYNTKSLNYGLYTLIAQHGTKEYFGKFLLA